MGVNHQLPQDPFVRPCRRKEKKAKGISDESEQEDPKIANKCLLESTVDQCEDSG